MIRNMLMSKLQYRLAYPMLAVALPLVLTVIALISFRARNTIEKDAEDRLRLTNVSVISKASIWIELNSQALQELVTLPDIMGMNPARQRPVLQAMQKAYPNIYLVSTTNLQGVNVARSDSIAPKNYSDRDWFQKALLCGKSDIPLTLIDQTLIGRTLGKPALVLSMPIRDGRGNVVGVGMLASKVDIITRQVRLSTFGKTGSTYVVDDKNRAVAYSDTTTTTRLMDLSTEKPVALLRSGSHGLIRFRDNQGRYWRAYIESMENGWGVIVQQREDDLFSMLYTFQWFSAWILMAGVAVLLILTWLIVRQVVRPIGVLAKTAAAISAGDLTQSVPEKSRDEIGSLAREFNIMTSQLHDKIEKLKQSNRFIEVLLAEIPTPVFFKDKDFRYMGCNHAFSEIMGVTSDQIKGKTAYELWPDKDTGIHQDKDMELLKNTERLIYEDKIQDKNGFSRPVIYFKNVFYDASNQVAGIVGAFLDITELKQVEEKIRKLNSELEERVAERTLELENTNTDLQKEIVIRLKNEDLINHQLQEKEILLKEIHHRVKNNMQVIISILNLQASVANDKKIVSILNDSQSRIRAMSLVHEALYQTKNFANINLTEYLTNLCENIFTLFISPEKQLKYSIDTGKYTIAIDTTISLGLITNELITNSFKYAFTEDRECLVKILLKKFDDENLILSISDNGNGLPENFNFKNSQTLGIQLVSLLTEQIKGKLEFTSSTLGTTFSIIFPYSN